MTSVDGAGKASDSIDGAFDVLRDPHRRDFCRYAMRTEADSVTESAIADYVVDRAPETADRRTVAAAFRHVHLPKLDDAGMIDYDRRSGIVHVDREVIAARLERVRSTVADLRNGAVDR